MSTQHTPGPWFTRKGIANQLRIESKGGMTVVCTLNSCMDGESAANARLIAAAIDLLEALEAVKAWDVSNLALDIPLEIRKQMQAAIAKATGEK